MHASNLVQRQLTTVVAGVLVNHDFVDRGKDVVFELMSLIRSEDSHASKSRLHGLLLLGQVVVLETRVYLCSTPLWAPCPRVEATKLFRCGTRRASTRS